MDALTRAAITGTSREAPPAGGLPADYLVGSAQGSPERNLLLRAGMQAVYETAGRKAEVGVRAPGPAPEETLPACSAKAAEVVRRLLAARRDDILREALERLRLAGLRLPHALLPSALDLEQPGLRAGVAAVLGERGHWLAGLDPSWGWVADGGSEQDDETVWEEGALGDRLAALRRVRRRDPGRGLAWVEDVWSSEKADTRVEMVAALESGLSLEDEPFLERALDDRSVRVRESAASLLARLPSSAYAERATARADAVLAGYEPPATGPLRRRRAGRLVVEPPEHLDAGWRRDLPGSDKPPHGLGEKAWRITLALSVVPPEHWEGRLGATPEELVVAARGEWEAALLTGWSRAAGRFGDGSWALPIWERCQRAPEKQGAGTWGEWTPAWDAALSLVPSMSQKRFAMRFRRLLREDGMTDRLATTLSHLPAPWHEELGLLYVEELRKHVSETFARNRDEGDHLLWTLQHAAEGIPPSCFERALFAQPDEVLVETTFSDGQVAQYEPHHLRHWRKELTKFEETLELRRKLVEEIPL